MRTSGVSEDRELPERNFDKRYEHISGKVPLVRPAIPYPNIAFVIRITVAFAPKARAN